MFDVDELIGACQEGLAETEPRKAIREVLLKTLSRPSAVGDALRPQEGGLGLLHNAPDLTVLHVVWAPQMRLYPHDHRMWAAIGIYTGQEDNTFYRRSGPGSRTLTESGGKELTTGDVIMLGDDAIHAVANPRRVLTGAIHVYGGDFVNEPRSQWGPGPLEERPYDIEEVRRQFAEANRAWLTPQIEDLLRRTYAAFNARDVDAVLATLHDDVDWPNVTDGVRVHGHDEVRAYWTRQFETIDPQVEPWGMDVDPEGRVVVDVHQVVRAKDGALLDDRMVKHVYTMRDGLVERMDVIQA